jgi:hypothetical protein
VGLQGNPLRPGLVSGPKPGYGLQQGAVDLVGVAPAGNGMSASLISCGG